MGGRECLGAFDVRLSSHPSTPPAYTNLTRRGGKVSMTLFLTKPHHSVLKDLIVLDIAPNKGSISEDFKGYLRSMRDLERGRVGTRKEADVVLRESVEVSLSMVWIFPLLVRGGIEEVSFGRRLHFGAFPFLFLPRPFLTPC